MRGTAVYLDVRKRPSEPALWDSVSCDLMRSGAFLIEFNLFKIKLASLISWQFELDFGLPLPLPP